VTTESDVPIGEGSILALAESDYCYGYGPLVVLVESLGADPSSFHRLEWVRVCGREVLPSGDNGREIDVLARVAALESAVRPQTFRP
jgi:hypothetical protein